jgi:hypothetical protein
MLLRPAVFIGLAAMLPLGVAHAQSDYLATGIGIQSCAFWLSDPRRENEGIAWLYGFWTGANMMNQRDRHLGSGTDSEGRVAEVKKLCSTKPSMSLVDAAANAYAGMARK